MKGMFVLLVLLMAAAEGSIAQQFHEQKMPDEQIIVNKKFNEKGELIGYDSTAIYSFQTDTTFSFGFPVDSLLPQWNFPGIEQFMGQFLNDSIFGAYPFQKQPFSFGFRFSPFDDAFKEPGPSLFADSLFTKEFPFRFDSLFFNFNLDPDENFTNEFHQKFMEDFEEQFNRQFSLPGGSVFPDFHNEKQRREWEQLMEKHRQEIDNLMQKWHKQEQVK